MVNPINKKMNNNLNKDSQHLDISIPFISVFFILSFLYALTIFFFFGDANGNFQFIRFSFAASFVVCLLSSIAILHSIADKKHYTDSPYPVYIWAVSFITFFILLPPKSTIGDWWWNELLESLIIINAVLHIVGFYLFAWIFYRKYYLNNDINK